MSDDTEQTSLTLRREALLPTERNRGLGTVAVVCTMAGVASGLALATTLMAMQVADSMSARAQTCQTRTIEVQPVVDARPDHGFLGITYYYRHGAIDVSKVIQGSPADMVGFESGDRIVEVDGRRMGSGEQFQDQIYAAHPGAHPTFAIEREGKRMLLQPTLIGWPPITY